MCAMADKITEVFIGCAAEMYDNQDEIGSALERLFSEGVVRRQDLWVTSKARPLTLLTIYCFTPSQSSRVLTVHGTYTAGTCCNDVSVNCWPLRSSSFGVVMNVSHF